MKRLGGFEIGVFKHGVDVYVGLPEDCAKNAAGYCEIVLDEQQVKIFLKEKDCFAGYVMHECVHAADFILKNIGADMGTNPNDSEVRAYMAEYIFCKVGCILGTMKYKPRKWGKNKGKYQHIEEGK